MDPNAPQEPPVNGPAANVPARETSGRAPKPVSPAPPKEEPSHVVTTEGGAQFDLADNDLQRVLSRWWDKISGYTGLLVAAGVVAAVAIGYTVITRSNDAQRRGEAWQRLASAEVAEQYAAVAQSYPGSEAATWARLSETRSYVRDGIRQMFSDRETAVERLEKGRDTAKAIVDDASAPEQAREQAALQYAVALESLAGADLGPAKAAYEAYVAEFPAAGQVAFAKARLEQLEEPETAEFYAWFQKQNPSPAAPPEPNDGLDPAPNPPAVDTSAVDTSAADTSAADTPDDESPADGSSDDASTDDASVDETPAASEE